MKKSLIAAAVLSASAIAAPAFAAPATGGQYFGAQLAIADVDGPFDSGLSFVGTFGMPLPQVNPNVAFEAELTKALVKPEYSWFTNKLEVDYWTLGGYGVYNIPANQQINFRGRLGLVYSRMSVDNVLGGSASDSGIDLSIGIGLTVKLQSNMSLIAEYTDVNGDVSHLSAGVQVKF